MQHEPDRAATHWLIAGQFVFDLSDEDWNEGSLCLTDTCRKRLADGAQAPAFLLPPCAATRWSEPSRERVDLETAQLFEAHRGPAPNPGLYYWTRAGDADVEGPRDSVSRAFVFKYPSLTGTTTRWFKPAIGVVRETSTHSGSFGETESTLVRFTSPRPGTGRRRVR